MFFLEVFRLCCLNNPSEVLVSRMGGGFCGCNSSPMALAE